MLLVTRGEWLCLAQICMPACVIMHRSWCICPAAPVNTDPTARTTLASIVQFQTSRGVGPSRLTSKIDVTSTMTCAMPLSIGIGSRVGFAHCSTFTLVQVMVATYGSMCSMISVCFSWAVKGQRAAASVLTFCYMCGCTSWHCASACTCSNSNRLAALEHDGATHTVIEQDMWLSRAKFY